MNCQTSRARLELCACGRHGRLLDDRGEGGAEFCSKSMAQFALASAVQRGRIDLQMTEDIVFQIEGSSLPLDDDAADVSLLAKVAHWNERLIAGGGIEHADFHLSFDN